MALLQQSATYTRTFLLVQSSDHVTGLTGATPTVNLSKAGGAFGAAAGAVSEIANGWYKVALTAADTGTLGDLSYHITAASADPTDFDDQVVAFNPLVADLGMTTFQLTEAYSALHTAPTWAQILFEIRGLLAEKSVSGTTLTVNKIDGATSAETFTLNDSKNPSSITRAS